MDPAPVTPPAFEPAASGAVFRGWKGLGGVDPSPADGGRGDLLEYLWTHELALAEGGDLVLPFTTIYELEPFERARLGIPGPEQGYAVAVRSDSYPGTPDFRISVIVTAPGGPRPLLPGERIGGWVVSDQSIRLLAQPIQQLAYIVDRGPKGPGRGGHLRWIASVRAAAGVAEAELDPFLADEELVLPEGFSVAVDVKAPDRLELGAYAEGLQTDAAEELAEGLARQAGPVPSSYTHRDGDRRVRVVLTDEERALIAEMRQRRTLSGSDVPKFLANPEAYLPDGVDVSRFSERVRGLVPQRYVSQPYVRVTQGQQRDWFRVSPEIELLAEGLAASDQSVPDGQPVELGGGQAPEPSSDGPPLDPDTYRTLCEEAVETGESWFLTNGQWVEVSPESARRYLDALEHAEPLAEGGFQIHRDRLGLILDVVSNVDQLEFEIGEAAPAEDTLLQELPEYPIPGELRAELMEHQVVGYRWLRYLGERGLGGLLADDMGLGKTVQLIAMLAHLLEEGRHRPALVVAPLSLLENWAREIRRFCPSLRNIYLHRGPERPRHAEAFQPFDVVLTTYDTLRRDQLVLGEVDWSVIACDEAQHVKNPTAQVTSSVKGMKATHRVALTGTPVENGLSELWCIVDFVQPGRLLSRKEFRETFERPIREAEADPNALRSLVGKLQERLHPHYLRRTKDDVLAALPAKSVRRDAVPMSERQRRLYAGLLARIKGGELNVLAGLGALIQLCSHPELVEDTGQDLDGLLSDCSKLSHTLDILDDVAGRSEKAVVFTRFRVMQDILQRAIRHRFEVGAPIINGDSFAPQRLATIDRFSRSRGFGVLILSPEAAGVGLNITAANHVVHYSRLWNPARENQATDRVHRYGQSKEVTVHLPLVSFGTEEHTVEEHLDELLRSKEQLARDVLLTRESLDVTKDLRAWLLGPEEAEA